MSFLSDTSTGALRRTLHGPSASREARAILRALLVGEPPEAVEVAVLLTSELVTNALLHGAGAPALQVEVNASRDLLRVTVADRGRDLPRYRRASSELEHGRGIAIVDHLSQLWGIRRDRDGKSVWFELRLPAPLADLPHAS